MATKKKGSIKDTDTVLVTSVNLAADVGATVLPVANGGTNVGSWTNGQIPIGNTTGNTLVAATITGTANQVVVTNGNGSITLSTPQNIDTVAAVQFASTSLIKTAITNDTSFAMIDMRGGADATLGPMIFQFGVHPSATGANRYAFLSCGDTAANRTLALACNGGVSPSFGNVGIGTIVAASALTFGDAKDIAVGSTTGTKIATATTQKLGFYNAAPIAQRSGAAQAAVATTASTQTTPWGFSTQAQADAIVTLVNELRAWAVAQGFIKGSA